jgi:hypothetical protein
MSPPQAGEVASQDRYSELEAGEGKDTEKRLWTDVKGQQIVPIQGPIIHWFEGLPVLAFAVQPGVENAMTSSYSYRLQKSFEPHQDYLEDICAYSGAIYPAFRFGLFSYSGEEMMSSPSIYLAVLSSYTRVLKRFVASLRGWTTHPGMSGQIERNKQFAGRPSQ